MQQQSSSAEEEAHPTRNKRPRRSLEGDEHSQKDRTIRNDTAAAAATSTTNSKKTPPPPYGSQAYWEERYQAQFAFLHKQQQQQQEELQTKKDSKQEDQEESKEEDTSTLAYHSWYFSYDELRPLLLPLLLGGREAARRVLLENRASAQEDGERQDESCEEEEEEDDEVDVTVSGAGAVEKVTCSEERSRGGLLVSDRALEEKKAEEDYLKKVAEPPKDESDIDEGVEFEEQDDNQSSCSDESDEGEDRSMFPDRQDGLASIDGPVAILELGCGDVPLGAALALELQELQQTTGSSARNIVKHILCTDYSPTVIETMRRQYCCKDSCTPGTATTVATPSANTDHTLTTIDIGNVPLEFATVDARALPYESNAYALVMEKGTLDAMLSDKAKGVRNCVSIVAECARVVKAGGCIMLVSHLNAHTVNVMSWLEEVVFAGLQQSQQPGPNGTNGWTNKGESFTNGAPSSSSNNSTVTWEIEVHGHDEIPQQREEDDEDECDRIESSRFPPNSAGPAVYIIHKKTKVENDDPHKNGTTSVGDPFHPTIPVKFFTY